MLLLQPSSRWLREAVVDVATGVWYGSIRAMAVVGTCLYVNAVRPLASLVGFPDWPEGKRPRVPNGRIKVAVVGFGRTGTYSLAMALEELGFPTLHTIHMYAYENEEILHMWRDRLVRPALEQGANNINDPRKLDLLKDIDLKLIASSGYQAVADLPLSLFYEQILTEFPDCKFILTTRTSAEEWYQSWTTLTRSITTAMFLGGHLFPTLRHYSNYLRWLYAYIHQGDPSYLTSPWPKDTFHPEIAMETYERHNRRVRQVIPAGQLLEYSVQEGWAPLCAFLELNDNDGCPEDQPFPRRNSGRQMRVQSSSAFWTGVLFVLLSIHQLHKLLMKPRRRIKLD